MSKFSIENIVIEKSDKDIKTGVIRHFSEGLNLILGNNEAGKSSLLAFIRKGFFKSKGVDKGKIYFKISDENSESHYRTDIQDNRISDMRCKVYTGDNSPVSYDFIKETINQKYFEQGFTIDLDDLMNIQNKDTEILINTIKDPSGEKLSSIVEKIKLEAKKILGDNNRLTKETAGILEKIRKEDITINELSNLEAKYNSAIYEIKKLNEELDIINKQEEYIIITEKQKELRYKSDDITEQRDIILSKFNDKLYNSREKYSKIIQNTGKVEVNKKILEKNYSRKEQLISKIGFELNRLKNDYGIEISESDIATFKIDFNIIKKLKDFSNRKIELEKELISVQQDKENIEENLLRLKHELIPYENGISNEKESEKLKDIYNFIDEYLTKFKYFQSKINDLNKSKKINSVSITTSRILFILLIVMFIMTVAIAALSFYKNVPEAGIFAVLMSVFILIGLFAMKISSYADNQKKELRQAEELQNKILIRLKEKIKEYYSEIDNIESSYLLAKIESLKTEIQNKMQNYTRLNDISIKNKSDTEYNKERLEKVESKINDILSESNLIKDDSIKLMNSLNNKIQIQPEIYIEAVDIIRGLKESTEELRILSEDNEEAEKENNQIIEEFNKFIEEIQLKISFGENYTENIQRLKAYNEVNAKFKSNIDILNVQIESINKQIKELEDKKNTYDNIDKNNTIEELSELKKEKISQKKETEYLKHDYEEFEGLNDIKLKKSVLLEEYRKKIYTLAKNKTIIQIIKTAKDGYDKIQPDLKSAQKYLEILTEGKYTKINLELEEIQSSNGTITKKWNDLSRGTKEQVYLALRLGYASNYTKDKITMTENGKAALPLIVDDAFVNFDAPRTRQGIKCLIEFSKTNQVLFFTCHNEVMSKHFDELCSEAGVELNKINM